MQQLAEQLAARYLPVGVESASGFDFDVGDRAHSAAFKRMRGFSSENEMSAISVTSM